MYFAERDDILNTHNQIRANVTPTAANMMKMVSQPSQGKRHHTLRRHDDNGKSTKSGQTSLHPP